MVQLLRRFERCTVPQLNQGSMQQPTDPQEVLTAWHTITAPAKQNGPPSKLSENLSYKYITTCTSPHITSTLPGSYQQATLSFIQLKTTRLFPRHDTLTHTHKMKGSCCFSPKRQGGNGQMAQLPIQDSFLLLMKVKTTLSHHNKA